MLSLFSVAAVVSPSLVFLASPEFPQPANKNVAVQSNAISLFLFIYFIPLLFGH